jgi:hypothetical protein
METLGLYSDMVQVVRNSTTPRHIRFEYRASSAAERDIKSLCDQLNASNKQKGLVYVDTIDNGTMLKDMFGWPFYHAKDRNTRQRGEMNYLRRSGCRRKLQGG